MHELENTFPKGKIKEIFSAMDGVIRQGGENLKSIALNKNDYEKLLMIVNQKDRKYGISYRGRRLVPCQK